MKFKIWATIIMLAVLIILTFLYVSGSNQDDESIQQTTEEQQ